MVGFSSNNYTDNKCGDMASRQKYPFLQRLDSLLPLSLCMCRLTDQWSSVETGIFGNEPHSTGYVPAPIGSPLHYNKPRLPGIFQKIVRLPEWPGILGAKLLPDPI